MSLSIPDYYNQPLYNAGSERIPPFAVVEIKSPGFIQYKGKEWLQVGKPSKDGKMYLLNGPFTIGVGTNGEGRVGGGCNPVERIGAYALYDPEIDPATNDALTPVDGQWWLGKGSGADDPPPGEESPEEKTAAGGFIVVGDNVGNEPAPPGFPASQSSKRVRVWLPSASAPDTASYALLIKDIPAAQQFAAGQPGITPGYATEACYPLEWLLAGVQDRLVGEKKDGQNVKLDVLNPTFLGKIFAKDTSKGAVIATGYKQTRNIYGGSGNPSKKTVFVIESINYQMMIFKATTQQTVTGGDFPVQITEVLWPHDSLEPADKFVTLKNPDEWHGQNGAYALGMRRLDGEYQALDLACEE